MYIEAKKASFMSRRGEIVNRYTLHILFLESYLSPKVGTVSFDTIGG